MGKVAKQPLPPRGSPLLQSGGQNHRWPRSGQGGYIPLPNRGSPPLQSGGKVRGGPKVGKVVTKADWAPTAPMGSLESYH